MRPEARERRQYWVAELAKLSGSFGNDADKMIEELRTEIERDGVEALLDHLRLCGAMPEQYGHDSSEEKLYSKYTDALVSSALNKIGLTSLVITTRADAADVLARGRGYSLVADAKAFRLSRTAKNQKDFKIQALDGWRNDEDFAVVVCPIYQLPSRSSQIYLQAVSRNVCILSYAHVAALVAMAQRHGGTVAEDCLHGVLRCVSVMQPSKNAPDYWTVLNGALVAQLGDSLDLWTTEKTESLESLSILKQESLRYLKGERTRLLSLSHQQALDELVRKAGLDSRIAYVEGVEHGQLLGV
jgi:hypothetical protein